MCAGCMGYTMNEVAPTEESTAKLYSVSEVERMVEAYYNTMSEEYHGDFVVFESETSETESGYCMVVRLQAHEGYERSGANLLFAIVDVNINTGEMSCEGKYITTLW